MRQKEKRLAAALLAAALCLAAVPQAFAEQGTYEWGDEAADSSVEDVAPSAPADSSADHGVITYSVEDYGLSTYSDAGWAVALDAETAEITEHEATTYSEGGFNVYTARTAAGDNVYTDNTDYTVTIPAEVEISTETNRGSFNIRTELKKCCNLAVAIAPTNNDGQFKVENGRLTGTLMSEEGAELPYRISDYKLVFWKNETNETKTSDTYTVNLRVPETTIVSGNYTDHLTFTMTPQRYVNTDKTLYFDTNAGDDAVIISTDYKFVTLNKEYGVLPTPRRDFYTFEGWYTQATDGEEIKETETFTGTGTENMTVYAHWKANTLTILYHNGGADYIQWDSDPEYNDPNRLYKKNATKGEYYTYHADGDQKGRITDLKKDITLQEIEIYGEKFTNGVNGLFNVTRWKRSGFTAKNEGGKGYWRVGEFGSLECPDHDDYIASTEDCADKLGVLADFKEGDVTVDLYPIWISTGRTIAESDEDQWDGDTIVILPDEDEADSKTEETTGKDETAGTDDATEPDDSTGTEDTESDKSTGTDTAADGTGSSTEEPEEAQKEPEDTPDDEDLTQDEEEEPSETVEDTADEPEEEELTDLMVEDELCIVNTETDFLLD